MPPVLASFRDDDLVFQDARELPEGTKLESDICIIGAGAAGMALAREFFGSEVKVALLESGGLTFDPDIQSLYDGKTSGLRYGALDTERLRYFGGSTNHWEGLCSPYHAVDFEERARIPHSGWPLGLEQLDPFYVRAAEFCQLESNNFEKEYWLKHSAALNTPYTGSKILPQVIQQSFLSGVTYEEEFAASPNVTVYLFASVMEIVTDNTASTVERLRIRSLESPEWTISAKQYVLATGGIENPRLLLLSNRVQKEGLGNGADLVGRYFMDHLRITGNKFIAKDPAFVAKHGTIAELEITEVRLVGIVNEQLRRREGLARCFFVYGQESPRKLPGYRSYRHLRENFGDSEMFEDLGYHLGNIISDIGTIGTMAYQKVIGQPIKGGAQSLSDDIEVTVHAEPTPNAESRVTLTSERDRLGLQKSHLHWTVNDDDKRSVRRSLEIYGQEMGQLGHGRLKIVVEDDEPWYSHIADNHHHHIGTTRMHSNPRRGVVDANCRVHGISNLHIAGSSIFPTAGSGGVTLTLIAMAIRLADHLKGHFV